MGTCVCVFLSNIYATSTKNAHLRKNPQRSNSTKGERACVCEYVLPGERHPVEVQTHNSGATDTDTILYRKMCGSHLHHSPRGWKTSPGCGRFPLRPRRMHSRCSTHPSCSPPSPERALAAAHPAGRIEPIPGKLVWCTSNERRKTPHFNEG